jgi:hypothetical protein
MVKAENIITGIYGWKGAGKTLIMTLLILMEWNMKLRPKVYSNYQLDFDFEYLCGEDMATLAMKLSNSIIAIDELHEYADCRNSHSLQNRRVATFFLQSRHTNSNLYYTTQYKDQVDKRIRRITDVDIVCENLYWDSDGDGDDDMFRFVLSDHRTGHVTTRTIYAQPIFNLYDSTERINPFVWKKKKGEETQLVD